jgi:hypothetical protein
MMKLDKESYSPFNRVNISLITSDSDIDSVNADKVYVDIRTKNANLTRYELVETESNSGNFTGYITLTGPDGVTEGKGPLDGKLKADRGEELLVSFISRSGDQIAAKAEINYHIARISFDASSYQHDDWARVTVIDEDLNRDPEKQESHSAVVTSSFMQGILGPGVTEVDVNSGVFVIRINTISGQAGPHNALFLDPKGEAIVAYVQDRTLPAPYTLMQERDPGTEGIWVYAVAHFPSIPPNSRIPPAPLAHYNSVIKTQSAIQDLKFLKYDKKIEFVNIADEEGTLELQLPRETFQDIASVSINHTNTDFVLKKNATNFNIQISYPQGTNKIEIFGLDTKSPIVFRDPALVDQEDNALTDLTVGSQVVIQSQITNSQTNTQPFAYIVQIKDENDVTVSLSWLTGELAAADSFRPAQSWLPEESGEYRIQTFLWNNLETPSPLAPSKNIEVQVIA